MGKTILFVDDYADIRSAASALLEMYGFRVILAADGQEAVMQAQMHDPDLILMDLAMPQFDGMYAAREIRSRLEFNETPLVAVTSHGDNLNNEAKEAGFDDVLDKSKFLDDVMAVVSRYLKSEKRW
jgi:CheY-like chemotaxis protein